MPAKHDKNSVCSDCMISCGYEVDSKKFKVNAMAWFYTPTSDHKSLIHGAEIIKHVILSIGQLGEVAQEAKKKDFKLFIREHRSSKDAAEKTNMDLFKYFLLWKKLHIFFLILQIKININHRT